MFTKINFLAAFCLCFIAAGFAAEAENGWRPVEIKNEQYLPLAQIGKFYGLEPHRRERNRFVTKNKKVEIVLNLASFECEMNGIKFRFERQIEIIDEDIFVSRRDLATLDAVLRPGFMGAAAVPTTVIIDAAHGGDAKGVENRFGAESDFALMIAKLARDELMRKGFDVVMTRDDDRALTLQERVDIANKIQADAVFISIGFSSGPRERRGIETEILSRAGKQDINFQPMATALATSVHSSVMQRLGGNAFDGGIRSERFAVLSGVAHPAVLLEAGYMTHEVDARLISIEVYRKSVADAIATAVARYRLAIRHAKAKKKDVAVN